MVNWVIEITIFQIKYQVENIGGKVVNIVGKTITKPEISEVWRQMVNWLIEMSKKNKNSERGGEVVHWLVKNWRWG